MQESYVPISISEMSISRFVQEVCQVIIENFMDEYMSLRDSKEKMVARGKVI